MVEPSTPTTPIPSPISGTALATALNPISNPTPTPKKFPTPPVLVAVIVMLVVSGTVYLYLRTNNQINFNQPDIATPSPSPRRLTRFASDPTLLTTEASVASTSASLQSLTIDHHPLLPPTLDMKVSLNK